MIRVLNVISDTNIGGAGRVILNYLRYADSSRFETWVAVPKGSLLKEPLEEAGPGCWRWTVWRTAPTTRRTSRR